MDERSFDITYSFLFGKNDRRDFKITIDSATIEMMPPVAHDNLVWTELEYKQCPCCQLTKDKFPHCPIALNISRCIRTFKDKASYEECIVHCNTPERTYLKKTSLMEGLASLLGLIMATSRCTHMAIFKPMARFHLPFSTLEETTIRSTSIYLLYQYFKYKKGDSLDISLKLLHEHYGTLKILNTWLMKRLSGLHAKDADRNAIVNFHCISELLTAEIDINLDIIKYLFCPTF